ncbi:unnamed protein product [Didymodactylos carnosus]|uniref:Reverse transcriptase domain-containing protein n=1 Tax=Didymodactylos carnosus TaxID=1234261 RepID=A0A8S2GUS4_9BILA|nr:unnamed protein product [Didymodactylos carnosus]CAF3563925.1 unnamed protein product [Didymodactylos carnosus]
MHFVHALDAGHVDEYIERMKKASSRKNSYFADRFYSGDSTTNQLVDLVHEIGENLDSNKFTIAVFLDFAKAFDKVWHKGLLYKLKQKGVRPKLLKWFQGYLTARKCTTLVNGQFSLPLVMDRGVPQGSILGPFLVLIFIDDICDNKQSKFRLFADDTSMYHSSDNIFNK